MTKFQKYFVPSHKSPPWNEMPRQWQLVSMKTRIGSDDWYFPRIYWRFLNFMVVASWSVLVYLWYDQKDGTCSTFNLAFNANLSCFIFVYIFFPLLAFLTKSLSIIMLHKRTQVESLASPRLKTSFYGLAFVVVPREMEEPGRNAETAKNRDKIGNSAGVGL